MNSLKEEIIVTQETGKLSLTMAYHNADPFNKRFFNPVEIAQEALVRSGKLCPKQFISKNEELFYFKKALEGNEYFSFQKFSDIKRINNAVSILRKQIADNEKKEIKERLEKGIFKEKNDAIFNVYCRYMELLEQDNKTDAIGLIRYAISNANKVFDECAVIEEYPLESVVKKLLNAVSGSVKETSVNKLLCLNDNPYHVSTYQNCYGTSNEVAWILSDIARKKYNPDECVVACADYSTYAQIFYDYGCKYDIDISFGNGLSIINSYPGKFLEQYYTWMSTGNFDGYNFLKMIYSPYFNLSVLMENLKGITENTLRDFFDKASRLRLTNNEKINSEIISNLKKAISSNNLKGMEDYSSYLEDIEIISKELTLPIEEFISRYAKERSFSESVIRLDHSAKQKIRNEIILIKNTDVEITADVIEDILSKKTSGMQNRPGFLYITSIDGAIVSLRRHLYICGLSASNYPGSPKENPLLLDSDLKEFGNQDLTSQGIIKKKTKNLESLLKVAGCLNNDIYISYPGLNVSELKTNNASSLIFEIFKTENGSSSQLKDIEDKIEKTGYFDPALSITNGIGNAYNSTKEIGYKASASLVESKTSIVDCAYSPSALNTFFNCSKQFYLQNILKIPAPDDYNPFEIISATERGTLVHMLMEYLAEHQGIKKEEFIDVCEKTFDDYLRINVPLIKDDVEMEKAEFLDMMSNGWDFDNAYKRKIIAKEEDIECIHKETGIRIHGYPDRVEETEDGKAVIIDFKTENKINKHKEDDIESCLQVIIYAYIVESSGKEIDHCEYRILRFENGIVPCKYDDDIKLQLTDLLNKFKHALETQDFPAPKMSKEEENERCKYCKYGAICGKEVIE